MATWSCLGGLHALFRVGNLVRFWGVLFIGVVEVIARLLSELDYRRAIPSTDLVLFAPLGRKGAALLNSFAIDIDFSTRAFSLEGWGIAGSEEVVSGGVSFAIC